MTMARSVQDRNRHGKSVRAGQATVATILTTAPSRWTVKGMSRRIVVVDDEPRVREVVVDYLKRDGFEVQEAADAGEARRLLASFRPDLVILDIMFPGASGLDLLSEIRKRGDAVAVILLTARADEGDRVVGLDLGADDYVVKPFSPRELVARVRSVLRRVQPPAPGSVITHSALRIDPAAREVTLAGVSIDLTAKEFDLLAFMASSPRRVFSRAELLDHVWDSSPEWQDPATVTVHVRRIRQKLEDDPQQPRWVTTVWGVGYRFEP